LIYLYYKDNSLYGNAKYIKKPIFHLDDLKLDCEYYYKNNPVFIHYTINPPFEIAVGTQLQDLQNGLYVTKPFMTYIQSLNWQCEEEPIFTMANDNILCPKCNYYMKVSYNLYTNNFLWKCKRRCNGSREAFNYNEKSKEFNVFRVLSFNKNDINYENKKNYISNHYSQRSTFIKKESLVSENMIQKYDKHEIIEKKLIQFEWTLRTSNCFKKANLVLVKDLVSKYERELLRIEDFGKKCLSEVKIFLELYNLDLGTFFEEKQWHINETYENNLSSKENLDLGLDYSPENAQKCFDYLYLSSKQGNEVAKWWISILYMYGENFLNIQSNPIESKKWLIKSAEKGYMYAQQELGTEAYSNSNYLEAVKWFSIIVDQNKCNDDEKKLILYNIGAIYFEGGYGIEQSLDKSNKFYKLSSDLGYDDAHFALGDNYYNGRGLEIDYEMAFNLFKLASEQEHFLALTSLAICYEKGQGVIQDSNKANEILNKQKEISLRFESEKFNPNLFFNLSDFEFSPRTSNCFETKDISYVGDLISYSQNELLQIPNFGRASLKEVKKFLTSLDLELNIFIENWPPENLEEISKKYSPNKKLMNTTSLVSLFKDKTILENITDYIENIPERDSNIIAGRSGLFNKPKTLDLIGRTYDVTRERIRQVEKKIILKINKNFLIFSKLVKELVVFLKGSYDPVSISSLETKYSYFNNLSENLDFYIYFFSKIINYSKLENKLNILEIDGSYFLTRFTIKEYEQVNLNLNNQIISLISRNVSRKEVEDIFNKLPNEFSDFKKSIMQTFLSSCIFEQNNQGEEVLVKFSKRKSAGSAALSVMLDSLCEMTGNEFADAVQLKYPGLYEARNILNQAFYNRIYPFSHGTFGMIRHLPFNAEELEELIDEIQVEINKKNNSEYHSREILPYLSPYFSQRLNDFKLTAIIRDNELDNYLGRNVFGPPNTSRTKIFDVIVDILRQEGRKMHASEILLKVNEIRSVDMKMQIAYKDPIIHLGDNMFDLIDR